MSFRFRNLRLDHVGVVGSGQIGPDIALHLARSLAPAGVRVTVVDVAADALARGRARIEQKVGRDREKGALAPAAADAVLGALSFTTDYGALADAGLVIEAATENLDVKRRIFAQLERLCAPDAILASNSSHIEPSLIFRDLAHRARALVIHYFFPAERNPIVEIVSGPDTSAALAGTVMALYEEIGKVPIRVGSRYGYAVNPVFEGLFLAAALAVEEGLGTVKEVDAAARRALGLGVGPFTAMNLTGGNPITHHALDEMTTRIGPWFRSPRLMRDAMAAGTPWEVPKRDEKVELPPERERRIADAMIGAYFGLSGEILDSGIVTLADLELGVEMGLVMKPPFRFMNEIGVGRALELVRAYAAAHEGFPVPACLQRQAGAGTPFAIDCVLRHDDGDVAVLTIRRPQVLNALNDDVYAQLVRRFTEVRDDPGIAAAVLTGFGTRAFVSGADVNFLGAIGSPAEGVATSERSKLAGNLIERLGKPVVCALNGFALGGGSELALCCSARLVRKGLPLAISQPESNLGIVPGAGATQRLPRMVGLELAAEMLRTGRALSGRQAVESGLVREEVDGDVVTAAVELARAAARGEVALEGASPAPLALDVALPDVDLGFRSRAIDALITRAIVEGCRRPLADGLRFESEMFGECCATEDMRIGVRTFQEKGPRAQPVFVHR
ncbi:MAG: 3-hydroxyacyl-CoA dehydrogenase/enoyl-CoA hydratase family protein [Gemmatimonadota bacterium]|nr:3-hydroxyacyl-CoA dehydrogenase/enoyl-CoA hydratase family protein [Gemmatimonadota bacterium]MDE3215794.1 3-hydroxyacyl-CoA dehydrogenase/enoyl-CoA hydratase family protein [Gemmatimonadota bacterium]